MNNTSQQSRYPLSGQEYFEQSRLEQQQIEKQRLQKHQLKQQQLKQQRDELYKAHEEGRVYRQRYHDVKFAAIEGERMQPRQAVSNPSHFAWMTKTKSTLKALFLINPANGAIACWRIPEGRLLLTNHLLIVVTGSEILKLHLTQFRNDTSVERPLSDFVSHPHGLRQKLAAGAWGDEVALLHGEAALKITLFRRQSRDNITFEVERPTVRAKWKYVLLVEENKIWIFCLGYVGSYAICTRCYTKTGHLLWKYDVTYSELEDRGWQEKYPDNTTTIQACGIPNLWQIVTTTEETGEVHSLIFKTQPFTFLRAIKGSASTWKGRAYIADGDEIRIDYGRDTIARISRGVKTYLDYSKFILVSDSFLTRIAYPSCWPEIYTFIFLKEKRSGTFSLDTERGLRFAWEKVIGCTCPERRLLETKILEATDPADDYEVIEMTDTEEGRMSGLPHSDQSIKVEEAKSGANSPGDNESVDSLDELIDLQALDSEVELEDEPWEDPDRMEIDE